MVISNSVLAIVLFNIFCSVLTENVDVRNPVLKERSVNRNNYRYNHPPSFESYEVVPENQNGKLVKLREEKSINFDNSDIKAVPVTVIYDAPIDSARTEENENNSSTSKGRRRKLRRRQQLVNKGVTESEVKPIDIKYTKRNEESVTTTERTISTPPARSTIVPKTFTKRPAEFNPIPQKPRRQREPVVKIVDEKNYVFSHSGSFHYSYEGGDGTKISSQGELRNFSNDATGEAVSGSVFYKDNEGNDVSLSYTADENGYRPYGAHLPTPPPIPRAIARALAYLATKSTPAPVTEAIDSF
ncbi:cuticular protein RR-1 motif 36 precursor [Danaus plexippus plexippus]|uniref:Cuticular protein RR-1 motif 36 n=1 Tax=Danaus plexippus plexippus TaxID=278856 RepID=A0A212FBF8_DANPL|nr:cuticular protein RR-1 motif 36 precursor [Danaus plexippus plexippus]